MNPRRTIAVASAIYDGLVAVMMVAGRPLMAQIFGVALPQPPIHADLNGLFLFAVAVGYVIPYREPDSRGGRTYLWVMGPLLKGVGAAAFVADYLVRHSPPSRRSVWQADCIYTSGRTSGHYCRQPTNWR